VVGKSRLKCDGIKLIPVGDPAIFAYPLRPVATGQLDRHIFAFTGYQTLPQFGHTEMPRLERESLNWSMFRSLKNGNWFERHFPAYCQIGALQTVGNSSA